MRSASVYACEDQASGLVKEALIHQQVEAALATLAMLERHVVSSEPAAIRGNRSLPGLTQVNPIDSVVALGRAAHHVLADVQKRTMIASDLDLEGETRRDFGEDIEQLVWSCTNTLGIVALGEGAWRSIQLLPIANRRFYQVPPLRMGAVDGKVSERRVLVINHQADDGRAWALADVLDRSGMEVEYTGGDRHLDALVPDAFWSDRAFIHVHVGDHGLGAEEPRLVDSWRSDRLAVQLVPRRGGAADPYLLMIEDEANGFICETSDEVVAACRELLDDRVLQRKFISAGQNSVAPLVKSWINVAEDLLG